MRLTLALHILAGGLGLLAGYAALFTQKGAAFHRKAGTLFVCAMLAMSVCGMAIAAVGDRAPAANIPAALTTIYLTVTAFTALRPGPRWLHYAGIALAFGVGCVSMSFGVEAVSQGGQRNGIPAFPFFLFGSIGLLGSVLDLRGRAEGVARIRRHLWRMTVALLIAAMSFFLGQAKVFPLALRKPALLSLPVLVVLVALVYWLWRVRARNSPRSGPPHSVRGWARPQRRRFTVPRAVCERRPRSLRAAGD